MAPEICPNCDTEVPAGARACPECGADENTGWSQSAQCDRLGIPDADEKFNYGDFVKNEFGRGATGQTRLRTVWVITAILLLAALLRWLL